MYVEIQKNRIELTPQTKKEEKILRDADVIDEENMLVYWGDTNPHGKITQGVIISWNNTPKHVRRK